MMFTKFLFYDLKQGIIEQKAKFILTFIVFFALSTYNFWILRIYELTNPEYFVNSPTTADYFIMLAGGVGKTEVNANEILGVIIPITWIILVLWIQFLTLSYPYENLYGIGKNLIVVSENRKIWWFSKCIWAVLMSVISYLIIVLSSFVAGLCFGAKFSIYANFYSVIQLEIDASNLTNSPWNILGIIVVGIIIIATLSLIQLCVSMIIKSIFSYLLIVFYIVSSVYTQTPLLIGNYLMGARNDIIITTGLNGYDGILICIWLMLFSIILGLYVFEKKDILGKD